MESRRIFHSEQRVLWCPDDQHRLVELAEAFCRLKCVPSGNPNQDFPEISSNSRVLHDRREQEIHPFGVELSFRYRKDHASLQQPHSECGADRPDDARNVSEVLEGTQQQREKILVRVTVGEDKPLDTGRIFGDHELADCSASVVADERHAVQA